MEKIYKWLLMLMLMLLLAAIAPFCEFEAESGVPQGKALPQHNHTNAANGGTLSSITTGSIVASSVTVTNLTVVSTLTATPPQHTHTSAASGGIISSLVFDTGVTTTWASTITTSGTVTLNTLNSGGYDIEIIIQAGIATGSYFSLLFNGDLVTTNYDEMYYGGATANNAAITFTQRINTGSTPVGHVHVIGKIVVTPGGRAAFIGNSTVYNTVGVPSTSALSIMRRSITSDITRLDIVSEYANAIGAGSRMRIWKRIL